MNDTQWPAYQVFKQEAAGRAHENVGSVHAPDTELSLLNARDVFVRRPPCVSLWVVPVDRILVAQGEQPQPGREEPAVDELQTYHVFVKRQVRGTHVYQGDVQAAGALQALAQAQALFESDQSTIWWVVPAEAVRRSSPDDQDSMLGSAAEKPFRQPGFYHTDSTIRRVRGATLGTDNEP
jgi:ring-1,2-phenylacetyl-CoA epoxidase subunit PaaB